MARFQIHKVTALPSPLEAHAIYLVTSGTDYVEIYVTGASASTVRRHINEADVQSLIDAAVGGLGAMDIVDDIAARDALDLSENAIVLVLDASADATISSGAATYAYRASPDLWVKISEAESMDLELTWASLSGKPSSARWPRLMMLWPKSTAMPIKPSWIKLMRWMGSSPMQDRLLAPIGQR
jgi:hypothetical protein